MKERYFCSVLVLVFLPIICFGGKLDDVVNSGASKNDQLKAAFNQFPLLISATNKQDKPTFQTLKLDKPLIIDGIKFYGFRIKVPQRANQEDFVWAFPRPRPSFFWYIIPKTGSMTGFTEYYHEPIDSFEDLDELFPTKAKQLFIQRLPGDDLEDGKEYLIWFAFGQQQPAQISLALTFAGLPSKDSPDQEMLEKALGLHRK